MLQTMKKRIKSEKKEKKTLKAKIAVIDYVIIFFGCIVYSTSINIFTAPNHIAPGGITGISTMLNYLFPFLPLGTMIFVMNIPLLIWGMFENGKHFLAKTIFATFTVSVLVDVISPFIQPYTYSGNPLLAAIFGGVLNGGGLAFIIYRGGTTGGTDIIAKNLNKRKPFLSMGTIVLAVDVIVIGAAAVVYKSLESALYSGITVFVVTKVMDSVIYGISGDNGKLILIITNKHEEIAQEIMNRMVRGVTLIDAQGGYNKDNKKVILCAVRPQQVYKIDSFVKNMDPGAFIVVTTAGAIKGNGFESGIS